MTPNFFQGARLNKIWVDFTGHPSNQFSVYRLNGQTRVGRYNLNEYILEKSDNYKLTCLESF